MSAARVCLLLACLLALLMPSAESLWIDEAGTYAHVTQSHPAAWWQGMLEDRNSEHLMPLGMLSAWLGARVFGTSEWGLRAPNIFWTLLALLAVYRVARLWRLPWLTLAFAVQPFVWSYANEARPYAQQIALGAWMAAGALHLRAQGAAVGWPAFAVLIAGGLLLANSLFGVVTVGVVFIATAWMCWAGRWKIAKSVWVTLMAVFAWGGAWGLYFLQGLRAGSGGARLWEPGLANLAFAIYEFAGFQGLGLPRNDLRELARSGGGRAILQGLGPKLLAVALLATVLFMAGVGLWKAWRSREKRAEVGLLLMQFAGVALGTYALSLAAHFPFWGRHLAPAFPFYFLLLALGLASLRGLVQRIALAGSMALLLTSSALARWQPAFAKDDYRAAARSALAAGPNVWWCADARAGEYYGLSFSEKGARALLSPTADMIAPLPEPRLLILSKPDVYDRYGALAAYLQAHRFVQVKQFPAFTLWEQPH